LFPDCEEVRALKIEACLSPVILDEFLQFNEYDETGRLETILGRIFGYFFVRAKSNIETINLLSMGLCHIKINNSTDLETTKKGLESSSP